MTDLSQNLRGSTMLSRNSINQGNDDTSEGSDKLNVSATQTQPESSDLSLHENDQWMDEVESTILKTVYCRK